MGDTQRWCSHAGTVVAGWNSTREIGELGDTWRLEKNWPVMDPDPDSLRTGKRIGLHENPPLVKNGRNKQNGKQGEFTQNGLSAAV